MESKKFIRTRDYDTRLKLLAEGFQEISSGIDGVYCFVNSKKVVFDAGKGKVEYTNTLVI